MKNVKANTYKASAEYKRAMTPLRAMKRRTIEERDMRGVERQRADFGQDCSKINARIMTKKVITQCNISKSKFKNPRYGEPRVNKDRAVRTLRCSARKQGCSDTMSKKERTPRQRELLKMSGLGGNGHPSGRSGR